MKVELEFSKVKTATAYLEDKEAIKNDEPKTEIHVLGGDFTLTKWDKERGLLHYKHIDNSERKVG